MPKLCIVAGGTGGHIYPGLAVANQLRQRGWQIDWLGTAQRMESHIVPAQDIPFHPINVTGLRGRGLFSKVSSLWKLGTSILAVRKLYKTLQPDVVLGMGGYVSAPGVIAAKLLSIPVVLHEQNAILGLTNKRLSQFANVALSGFELNNTAFNYVGNPVRDEFFVIEPTQTCRSVLVVGGSLGAAVFNQALPAQLTQLGLQKITHQTGRGNLDEVKAAYVNAQADNQAEPDSLEINVVEFFDDIAAQFAQHDLIICRAGALTVAEVSAAGKVGIFIPFPYAVDNHQHANASYLADADAAVLIEQSAIEQIKTIITELLNDSAKLTTISQNAKALGPDRACTKICAYIEELIEV